VDVVVLGRAVRRRAVAEVRVPDELQLLEQLERPVHGGDVHARHAFADLLRGRVAELAHGREHPLALRRDPQPAGAQGRRQVGCRVLVHPAIVGSVTGVEPASDAVLAVLGVGVVDPSTPVIRADDAGVTRGDGCFEGLRVVDGAVDKLDAHLARMARSSAALELPFDVDAWRELVAEAVAAWPHPGEAAMKLVLTRGPVGYAWITPLPADYPRLRRDGLRIITLSRGTTVDAFAEAPWLLGGVKTLISHNFYSEEEFWRTWNRGNYQAAKARTDPDNVVTSSAHLVARSRLKSTARCTESKYLVTGSVRSMVGNLTRSSWSVNVFAPFRHASMDFSVTFRAWVVAAM